MTITERLELMERWTVEHDRLHATLGRGVPTAAGSEPLSPRLRQVVILLVRDAMTVRQVAATLCVSTKTVESHVSRLYARLGVSSRAQLFAWAHAHPDEWQGQ